MAEPVRSLFVPLSLAVGFAMVSSYVLSSTVVPVLSVWLLKHHGSEEEGGRVPGESGRRSGYLSSLRHHLSWLSFARAQAAFGAGVGGLVRRRWLVVPVYVAVCVALLWGLGPHLGTELFPQVDSGEFVLRFRAPPGSNFEITRQIWTKSLQVIQEEAAAENVAISMGFAGRQPPIFSVNNLILFMRGPDDGQMRVALREGSGVRLQALRERLRQVLPEKVKPWLAELLRRQGLTPESAKARARQARRPSRPRGWRSGAATSSAWPRRPRWRRLRWTSPPPRRRCGCPRRKSAGWRRWSATSRLPRPTTASSTLVT